jgi:hypothetical protein
LHCKGAGDEARRAAQADINMEIKTIKNKNLIYRFIKTYASFHHYFALPPAPAALPFYTK